LADQARLTATEDAIAEAKIRQIETQKKLKELVRSFSPKLPTSVLLSILGQLGKKAGERAACVKRESEDEDGQEIEAEMPQLGHGGQGTELQE